MYFGQYRHGVSNIVSRRLEIFAKNEFRIDWNFENVTRRVLFIFYSTIQPVSRESADFSRLCATYWHNLSFLRCETVLDRVRTKRA